MKLTGLEQLVFSCYLAKGADQFHMDPRYWPPLELSQIIEDKIRFAVSRFDLDNRSAVDNVAKAFLTVLIERQAFSTSKSPYGPMYQFQPSVYRDYLSEAQKADPIVAQAQTAEPEFWQRQFEALKGQDAAAEADPLDRLLPDRL